MSSALPKFNLLWFDPIAAPEGRQRYLSAHKFALHLFPFHLEELSGSDHMALGRSPGGELTVNWPGDKIGEHFPHREFFGLTTNDYLPFQREPQELLV